MKMLALGATALACVVGLNLGAAFAEEKKSDYWLVALHSGAAHFLDAASIKTDASGAHSVAEWVSFSYNRGVTQLNTLEIDCRERRARQTFRTQMEPAGGGQFIVRSIPAQRLGDAMTQWRVPAEGDVRHNEIGFVCATEAERAANPNWRRVGEDLDEARRTIFEEPRPTEGAARTARERVERVTLGRGEAVTLEIDVAGGAVWLVHRGEADLSAWEQPARDLVANHPEAVGPNTAPLATPPDEHEPPPIEPNRMRVSFASFDGGKHTLLLIENGYDQGFSYRAIIRMGRRSEPTDVCTVSPNLRSLEHWPYRIDRIELHAFQLLPWNPGDGPVCR